MNIDWLGVNPAVTTQCIVKCIIEYVQYSKLCEQLADRGSKQTRPLPFRLMGEERKNVESIFADSMATRIDLNKFKQQPTYIIGCI